MVDRRQLRPHDELALVREVACLQRCAAHPGVLQLRAGSGSTSGLASDLHRHYVVTELLGGGDLFDRVVGPGEAL